MTIGPDTSLHSILVISKRLLVAGCCQRHLILSANVILMNNSVQDVDVWHLVKSPKVLVYIFQKIVQALVFLFIQRPGVTKRLANSSARTVTGIKIIASRLSRTRNLTCKGLPSGIQKIVVMKWSPC